MSTAPPKLTLYFLQASRSIRVAWLLSELNLPYTSVFFPRVNNKAPDDFKERSGSKLGKAPVLKDESGDGEIVVLESGAITEYILQNYDPKNTLSGDSDLATQSKVREWIHAAEGTFMVHALAIIYARWNCPEGVSEKDREALEGGMAGGVRRNLNWLEGELWKNWKALGEEKEGYLVGGDLTAADTMCLMSIQFIFARDLAKGLTLDDYPMIKKWVGTCEAREGYIRAIEKTGHKL